MANEADKACRYDPYVPKSKRNGWTHTVTRWVSRGVTRIGKSIKTMINNLHVKRRVRRAVLDLRARPRRRLVLGYCSGKDKCRRIAALVAIAMSTTHVNAYHNMWYNTDSGPVGIDNRCTACISHVIADFDGPLDDVDRSIRGFGGSRTTGVKKGTLVWRWEDDEGKPHKFKIPNSYYVPAGGVRLLSPQHLTQV